MHISPNIKTTTHIYIPKQLNYFAMACKQSMTIKFETKMFFFSLVCLVLVLIILRRSQDHFSTMVHSDYDFVQFDRTILEFHNK